MNPLHFHLMNVAQLIIMDYVSTEKRIWSALLSKQKMGLEYILPFLNYSKANNLWNKRLFIRDDMPWRIMQ